MLKLNIHSQNKIILNLTPPFLAKIGIDQSYKKTTNSLVLEYLENISKIKIKTTSTTRVSSYQNENLKNKVTHGVDDESLEEAAGISLFSMIVVGKYFSL